MVPKTGGSDWRSTVDYRQLNAKTISDRHTSIHLHHLTATLKGTTVFPKVDSVEAYNQIPIAANDIPKTIIIKTFGLC